MTYQNLPPNTVLAKTAWWLFTKLQWLQTTYRLQWLQTIGWKFWKMKCH